MRKFRIATLLLCAALLVGSAGAVFVAQPARETSTVWGSVESIDGTTLHVKNSSDQPMNDVIIHMQENAPIIDAVSGSAVKLADVKVGTSVYVEIGMAVALSMPPQATGLGLITNIPADYKVPQYGVIGQVTVDTDGDTKILTDDGTLLGRVTKDTVLTRYVKAGEAANTSVPTLDELKPGCEVYLWYGASTKSIPAQMTLDKVLIVPSKFDGNVQIGEGSISIDGKALTLTEKTQPVQDENAQTLLPLRVVAEAAGWTIGWTSNDQPITLTKGNVTLTLTMGAAEVAIGSETLSLAAPTQLRGGVTFVDYNLFTLGMNLYSFVTM